MSSFITDTKATNGNGEKKQPMDDNNFKALVESLKTSRYRRNKDKLTRIKAVCGSHTLTSAQILNLVSFTKGCNTDTAVICYASCSDPESFKKTVVDAFKWEEEKTEVSERIQKEYGKKI
ncbi:hypothetical protein AAMO2058_000311000 [Amorphochlora amoebiformis]